MLKQNQLYYFPIVIQETLRIAPETSYSRYLSGFSWICSKGF